MSKTSSHGGTPKTGIHTSRLKSVQETSALVAKVLVLVILPLVFFQSCSTFVVEKFEEKKAAQAIRAATKEVWGYKVHTLDKSEETEEFYVRDFTVTDTEMSFTIPKLDGGTRVKGTRMTMVVRGKTRQGYLCDFESTTYGKQFMWRHSPTMWHGVTWREENQKKGGDVPLDNQVVMRLIRPRG